VSGVAPEALKLIDLFGSAAIWMLVAFDKDCPNINDGKQAIARSNNFFIQSIWVKIQIRELLFISWILLLEVFQKKSLQAFTWRLFKEFLL